VRIEILQNRRTNRPNGDGHVYFNTMDDINEAMKCDRKFMGKGKSFFSTEKKTKDLLFCFSR
jgi:hypothetical protein